MRLEPAEVIWLGLVGAGVTASALLIEAERKPLTAVAKEHPVTIAYFVGHFLGVVPKPLDPISLLHGAFLRRRAGGRGRSRTPVPVGPPPGNTLLALRHGRSARRR